jgi:hypothetical protein
MNKVNFRYRYAGLVPILEDDTLYTPAAAERHILSQRAFSEVFPDGRSYSSALLAMRTSLAAYARRVPFPALGDGTVNEGRADFKRAYYGWRFKGKARPKDYLNVVSLARELMRQQPARPVVIAMRALLMKCLLPDAPFWNEFNHWLETEGIGPLPDVVV